jgi:hypothetical protein
MSQPSTPAQDADAAPLVALLYVSQAARAVTTSDLVDLLVHARRRNLQEDLTGVLLYADGSFMQYLEGPAQGMQRVYRIIKAHPLHFGVVDLLRQPIAQRQFAEWSMACHVVGADGDTALCDRYDLLLERLSEVVRPRSPVRDLLTRFHEQGRAALHRVPEASGREMRRS